MHCSANMGAAGDVALFFGLSGTGKTTLSADPSRRLIGDDEHGWSDHSVFNFEGGCYAKVIRLSPEAEPQIYNAIRFGSILENVVVDPHTRAIDYDSDFLTENTRATYPVEHIPNAVLGGVGDHPRNVFFLTCDAFGVLPPIAKLTPEMASYHFLSGFTAKVAGTEVGVKEPRPTFSTCFGAPFMPLHPTRYATMLAERLAEHGTDCWLVNTGWTRRPLRHRPAHEHPGHARPAGGGARRPAREGQVQAAPGLPRARAAVVRGHRRHHPRPARHVGRQGGLRRHRPATGAHVRRELRSVRGTRQSSGDGRRPQGVASVSLRIVVLVKQVPDTQNVTGEAMKDDGTVNRAALPAVFNPEDLNALEEALRLKERHGGRVSVITMGPPAAVQVLRESLYRGADEVILLSDKDFAGADTLATSYTLALAVRKLGPVDLVLCGRQAIDGDTAQVGPQTAEKLGMPQITCVSRIDEVVPHGGGGAATAAAGAAGGRSRDRDALHRGRLRDAHGTAAGPAHHHLRGQRAAPAQRQARA